MWINSDIDTDDQKTENKSLSKTNHSNTVAHLDKYRPWINISKGYRSRGFFFWYQSHNLVILQMTVLSVKCYMNPKKKLSINQGVNRVEN